MKKMLWRKHPIRKIGRLPTASDTAPEMRRVHPVARAYMDTGLFRQHRFLSLGQF
ncbi:hypothetical protein BDV41DRAFT_546271 [Aspergillus transmontanensis]|uniref:Uncharacterized protein n=1 Tax=Aspergillus transmontanensis TaxID=1034304 RepID=A0A5N6VN05_9EURO|nr:hypothetical protein BDV41DRAFT_546271 [Aspergillus transmontanensis]